MQSQAKKRNRSTWRLSPENEAFVRGLAERFGVSNNSAMNSALAMLRATRKIYSREFIAEMTDHQRQAVLASGKGRQK